MNDLISRRQAIDVLGVFTQADALGHTPKQIVEALPSAQPEQIRCKDCVYVSPNTKKGCELRRWRWFDGSEFMDGDDYCSKAERREE